MFISQESFLFVRTRIFAAFWIAAMTLLTLGAWGTISRLTVSAGSSTPKFASALSLSPLPQGQSDVPDTKGLVIALRPNGFSPSEIELADGRYLFIVQNRVRIRDLTFLLDREAGGRLNEVHDQKLQWKKEFDLHPGTYVLSVAEYPKWRCLIRVSPQ